MTVDYIDNPNQRTPCVLVLDASWSMNETVSNGNRRIDQLNEGLVAFEKAITEDDTALGRVQISIVIVGGPNGEAEVMMDWTDAVSFQAFPLSAGGGTPLAEGLIKGLEMVEVGKRNLTNAGIGYTRPWMIVISDGEPTSRRNDWNDAISKVLDAESDNKVVVFPVGVEGASLEKLGEISSQRPVASLSTTKFDEFFLWLSSSLGVVSRSRPGDELNLPSTDPWKNVGI